ncbi:GFA family protein [Roseomonas sp. GC11]|uniref:GFA family protein n=1 Tax=Roseomonas sp. GC11 TaxID=2950546 RepID=UPI00210B826B|nr:GFA family protein [Roseomonas sp. GC11]MCQ4158411.1 GFA family protein [Roseomonas sp. GC11]
MLHGGCHCGELRYEAGGTPYHITFCHCADCRRSSGAPLLAWFSVPASQFRLTRGSLAFYASSPGARRGFCPACGASLTYQNDQHPHEVDITAASLDDPAAITPEDHLWFASRLPWMVPGDTLPRHARERGGSRE